MATQKRNAIIILLFLYVNCALGDSLYESPFTKEIKLKKGTYPVIINNEFMLFNFESLLPIAPGRDHCELTGLDVSPKLHYKLGNGKLLLADETVTHLNVIDFKNCSSYVVTSTSNRTRDFTTFVHPDEMLASVVVYNETFDVFDWYQETCMPCRYNDKGERLPVEFPLKKEPTGEDPRWAHQHSGYSLELVKDAFGVKNGYFYVFRYVNGTTALRILDSKFKVVKERLFPAHIENYSLLKENLTACYKHGNCEKYQHCEYVVCHLLDANLNSLKEVKLHQSGTDDSRLVHVQWTIRNLIGGGAMVAMQFQYGRSELIHHKDIFIQRIQPSGRVDDPIKFDSVYNEFVLMNDFTFDNGEYCLVNHYYDRDSYTLIKCLNPSPADYQKDLSTM